ncbi:MAG TPA: type IX secretion system protein PorQ [Lacibacter sp.]|nr:type IX secretion system protein PorQ [Lacibacter sp.]HMO90374.1 type IX secretion system protein PorQ [Lacibacter sp.]HMP86330.1 type IX secretion system protein PorQ [Lacibacter sp.]
MARYLLHICLLCLLGSASGQTLGGQNTYNFLRFPAAPQLSALGGVNVSQLSDDLSLAFHNPARLNEAVHSHLVANFNTLYNGISNYHWMQAYRHPQLKTTFAAGVYYFNYGSITQTDAVGNIEGNLRPRDFVIQLSAGREYLEKWRYGATVKYIGSNYGIARSAALAADAGVLYYDSARFLQMSVVASNMGGQLKRYSTNPEELPFDLVFGISKRLEKAPIQFSFTAHHLHRFDLLYNDTLFNNETGATNPAAGKFTIDQLFRHFVFSTQLMIGQRVEVTAGYNYLRRSELRIQNAANGLVGFSLGVGALFPKLQLRYARSYYQNATAYNQLGLNLPLNKYFGLGQWGEKHGW